MLVTSFYAGLLGLLFVGLALRVIGARRGARVALGDGGDINLLRRMRVHANFAEYVPLAVLLLALAESQRTDVRVLHAIGVTLVAGRLLHAIGVSQPKEWLALRITGMMATFSAIIAASIVCLLGALRSGQLF